jgi:AraC-like DNA-binding protein
MARHTSLPIVLLTEQRIWQYKPPAPRDCIWEHLVKPVSVGRFCECLESITQSTVLAAQPAAATSIAGYSLADGKKLSTRSLLPAVSYVSGNYSEKLRLSTAAKLCDLSRFQFSRTFKKEQGLTFRDFVVQQRIQRAADLMRQSRGLSITEVAFAVGFNDLSYFSRIFRRQFGVTPSNYRRTDCEPTQLPLFAPNDTKKT